jgi:hypothetical protein
MRYPFPPAETVEFFRQYYGPTQRAFASLDASAQAALRQDLVELQTANNIAKTPATTEVAAEYLEVVAKRMTGSKETWATTNTLNTNCFVITTIPTQPSTTRK